MLSGRIWRENCRNMPIRKEAWRESASLIILARNPLKTKPNYQVLVLRRPDTMKFMPKTVVFPGGAVDPSDESREWLEHFKNCGVTEQKLMEVTQVEGSRPSIFQTSGLSVIKKEISLRITAIRETFEEAGVLFCRSKDQIDETGDFGKFVEEFNREQWQQKIIKDPSQFMSLCKEYELVPDIWKLYEWSAWLTPAVIPKRFQTAFFIVSTEKQPALLPHKDEACDVHWATADDLLGKHCEEKIELAPPQIYELQRIQRYDDIEAVTRFARYRNNKGTTLTFPIVYPCVEGLLVVLPADDFYPKNVDFNLKEYDITKYSKRTFAELRNMSNNMHRCEQRSMYDNKFVLNIDLPNGHISPIIPSKL